MGVVHCFTLRDGSFQVRKRSRFVFPDLHWAAPARPKYVAYKVGKVALSALSKI